MNTAEGYVDVDGGTLWYERAGDGFPVVLIHGRLWDARIWDQQFEGFSSHHDVVRYDLRGSGGSSEPVGPYSDLRDLLTLLDALEVGRCALVGCDSGAKLALDLALANSGLVEGLVLAAPGLSGYRWQDPGLPVLREEVARAAVAGDLEAAMDLELAIWAPPGSDPASDERVRAIAMDNLRVLRTDRPNAEEPASAVERLDEVGAATLVVMGDGDLAEIHGIADRLTSSIPGARKRVIAEADLLVNVRRPEKFNRLVLDFLSFRV